MLQEEENIITIPQMVDEVRAGKMPRIRLVRALKTMGISTTGIGAITAAASHSIAPNLAPLISTGTIENTNLCLQDEPLTNQAQGNADALNCDYAENAVVEDSRYPEPFVGRAAIMTRRHGRMPAIPDLKITVTNRVIQVNQVSTEWIATGTQIGDLPGLPASGRSFSIPGVTVVVRQHGKIVRESLYYDMEEVRCQLTPETSLSLRHYLLLSS